MHCFGNWAVWHPIPYVFCPFPKLCHLLRSTPKTPGIFHPGASNPTQEPQVCCWRFLGLPDLPQTGTVCLPISPWSISDLSWLNRDHNMWRLKMVNFICTRSVWAQTFNNSNKKNPYGFWATCLDCTFRKASVPIWRIHKQIKWCRMKGRSLPKCYFWCSSWWGIGYSISFVFWVSFCHFVAL